jgi:hypothetical protein
VSQALLLTLLNSLQDRKLIRKTDLQAYNGNGLPWGKLDESRAMVSMSKHHSKT